MRALTVWLVKAALTVALLTWLLSRPGVRDGLDSLGTLTPGWLVTGFVTAGLSLALAALRWHLCLKTAKVPLPFLTVLRLTLISTAAGFLSIGTLGADAVRVALAARRWPSGKAALLGSIGLDHVSAAPAFVFMAMLVLSRAGVEFQAGPWTALALVAAAAGFIAIGLLLRRFHRATHDRLRSFLMEPATRAGFGKAALLSVPVMLSHYAVFFCAAKALGVHINPVTFAAAASAADVTGSLPLTIAGLGVREKTFETLLGFWENVPPASAIALSLAGLGLILLWGVIGAICFFFEPVAPATTADPAPSPAA